MSYIQLPATSGLISIGNTGARLSDSRTVYPLILNNLNEFRKTNKEWEISDQEQFAVLLREKEVFNISTDTVVGSAKDVRVKTGFLYQLGFTNATRLLSNVGLEILRLNSQEEININEFDLSEDSFIYLKQFLKYQHTGFEIKPILSLIYSILEFDNNLSIDFLTFIWSNSNTKEELIQNITTFKETRNIKQVLYNNCLTSDSVLVTRENCASFFNKYTIDDENELNELMYSILPHGKGNSFKDKTINLFKDFYRYWINKDAWSIESKETYIKENIKSRYNDINSKKSVDYLVHFFNTTTLNSNSNWNDTITFFENTPLMSSSTVNEFVVNFHVLFMFIKKLSICYEYQDLNIRHLKLLDIFIFEHDSVKLDLIFEYLFKPNKERLLEVNILENDAYRTFLETNQEKLSDIYDFLDVEPSNLSKLIAIDHPEVVELGLKNFAYNKREERFIKLVEEVFTRQNIITLFESIYPRNDKQIRKLIKEWYSDYDATIPALFEYLLGISFYWISQKKIKISDVLDSGLDANLLPKTHAGGGKADIIIKSLARHYLIEATLSENDGQRKMEAEPVPRHLAKHMLDVNENSLALFVAGQLDPNNLVVLRNYKFSKWYGKVQSVDSMNILPLSVENMIYLLKEEIDFELFESKVNELLGSQYRDGKEWYDNEINKVFNYA